MAEQSKADDPDEEDLEEGSALVGAKSRATAAAAKAHLAEVEAEAAELGGLDPEALGGTLRAVIAGSRRMSTEALVRISAAAHRAGNPRLLNLAFEAAAKTATPLLFSQAFGQADDERREQVQEVLLQLFTAIRAGKSQLAETFFAKFAKRRSIDLFRKRDSKIEAKLERSEPAGEADPVDELPEQGSSLEARILLSVAVDRLPTKFRTAFIQKYHFGMTQEEIAEQNDVDVRTVHEWLKAARTALGLEGDENDR